MAPEERQPRIGNERFRYAAILAKVLFWIYEETELEFDDLAVQEMAKQLYNRLWTFIINPQQHEEKKDKTPRSIGSIELEVTTDGVKARGRNGYFTPRSVELFKFKEDTGDILSGLVEMNVFSSRAGKMPPIRVRMTQNDWRRFHELLDRILMRKEG